MKKVTKQNSFYVYSKDHKPALSIRSGETVQFETMDCLSNVLRKQADRLEDTSFDKTKVNPATGPIYIEDAHPGDVLEIRIDEIALDSQAVITCQAGSEYGVFGDWFEKTTFKITPIENGMITFDSKLRLPVDKMVGVMGVTPLEENIPTGMLGRFGGNMDNTMLREGATLYLPVFVDGALFACGDVHASMGDGEINCSALEAAAHVTLTFTVRKDLKIVNPIVKTKDYFMTTASEQTLDKAVEVSVKEMALILKEKLPVSFDTVSMLMSMVGHSQICQVVSPLKTARFCMPYSALNAYGFTF